MLTPSGTVNTMPWAKLYERGWRIIGLNHYRLHGKPHLFCSMGLHGRCIKAEGEDEEGVFRELERLAEDDRSLQDQLTEALALVEAYKEATP